MARGGRNIARLDTELWGASGIQHVRYCRYGRAVRAGEWFITCKNLFSSLISLAEFFSYRATNSINNTDRFARFYHGTARYISAKYSFSRRIKNCEHTAYICSMTFF